MLKLNAKLTNNYNKIMLFCIKNKNPIDVTIYISQQYAFKKVCSILIIYNILLNEFRECKLI